MAQGPRPARRALLLAAVALACLVAVVFFPVLGFEFVDYDVTGQVLNNPHIRGLTWENVRHIFTSRCVTSYYPVRTLSFALDYQLWGLNAGGFKLTGGLIHLANVLLLFWLVLRLFGHPAAAVESPQPRYDVFSAAFSAGIFAVHPLVVEPVVWVAGREELLMMLGALGCIHLHLTARRLEQQGGKPRAVAGCYVGAALCCVAACLSNALGAVIPLLVTTGDALMLARPKLWRIVRGTAALWVIGGATIVIKRLGYVALVVTEPDLFSAKRLMLMLNVYWLNLKSLVWPMDLTPARKALEPASFLEPEVILGGVAAGFTCVLLWKLRRRTLLLFGLLWFGLALAPSSQITVHHVHRADRFLYLPLAGLTLAVAMGLRPLGRFLTRPMAKVGLAVLGLWGLLVLGILSAGQVQTWRNSVSMWENCVRVEPDNALAHYCLGYNLAHRGQFERALRHRETQIELDLHNAEAMRWAAMMAVKGSDSEPPNYRLAVQLARRACELNRWENPVYLQTLAVAHSRLAQSLVDQGDLHRAVDHYHTALKADPDCQPALVQLAVVLATCNDTRLRNPREAIRLAERACQLTDRPDLVGLMVLSTAYAEAWEFDKAITTTERAIELAESSGQTQLVDELRRRLELYRKRIPPESLR